MSSIMSPIQSQDHTAQPPPSGFISPVLYRIMATASPPDEDPDLAPLSKAEMFVKLRERFGKAVRTYPISPSSLSGHSSPMHLSLNFRPQGACAAVF
jgi:hypothetical protein